ncbi:hypothetical protein FQA23_0008158, partial [Aptenodytes patagonicus]
GAAAGPSSRLGVLPAALCRDHLACSSNRAAQLVSTAAVRFQGRQADFTPTGHWTCRAETVLSLQALDTSSSACILTKSQCWALNAAQPNSAAVYEFLLC